MPMDEPEITGTNHILPFGELAPLQFERLCLWLVEREGYERAEHLGAGYRRRHRLPPPRRGSGGTEMATRRGSVAG
jgi:hypothetical protein